MAKGIVGARGRKIGAPPLEVRATVEVFSEWRPIDNSLAMLQRAWQWADEAQLAYWDGLIVAAAERGLPGRPQIGGSDDRQPVREQAG